jgi:glutamate-1-semialdehyde 2,1-aminomutase
MGAMNEFLRWVKQPDAAQLYEDANQQCAQWVHTTNEKLAAASLPLRIVHLGTVWTVLFKAPSRYNWLLQYYLRAEGITLSWVGTGRCLSSLDFTPADYQDLQTKFLTAAQHMKSDGWWLSEQEQPGREKKMRSRLIWEMLGSLVRVPKPLHSFCAEVMRRKRDDHVASHSHVVNQFFHLLSSSVFIYCYVLMFSNLTTAVCFSLAALLVRQFGHAVIEPPCHDKEELLLGFNTRNKTLIVVGYGLIPIINMAGASAWTFAALADQIPAIAQQWFGLTVLVVLGRVLYLMRQYNFRISMIWFVKLITDPFTDIVAYSPRYLNAYQVLLPACFRKGGDK